MLGKAGISNCKIIISLADGPLIASGWKNYPIGNWLLTGLLVIHCETPDESNALSMPRKCSSLEAKIMSAAFHLKCIRVQL